MGMSIDGIKAKLDKSNLDSDTLIELTRMIQSDYNARLKADMVAILTELVKEINPIKECEQQIYGKEEWNFVGKCQDVIQQKINELKAESEDNNETM